MTSAIIGAAGFVGPYLINEIQNNINGNIIATKLEHETFKSDIAKVVNLDILNKENLYEFFSKYKPDFIFHLAAQSSVALSWENPGLTIDINIKGAVNLLDTIREINSYNPNILIIGSGEEYGFIDKESVPINEECNLKPGNIYAATKSCQNMIATIYAKAYNMNIVMTRSFNHFGPKQAPMFVIADFCKQVANIEKGQQEPIIKVGNLSSKRDFTDVRDVVAAYVKLIQSGKSGETYNVGSGKSYKIEELLNMIIGQSTTSISVETDKNKFRPIDIPIIEADTKKIYNDTGWKPKISIDKTIQDTLNYWRNN